MTETNAQLSVEQLQQKLWLFAEHRVITVAGRLGVLSALCCQAETSDALATQLGLDSAATEKLLRALHAIGLLEAEGDRYRVVASLRSLFDSREDSILPFLEHSHHLYESWANSLEPWLKGHSWERHKRDEAGIENFGAAMEAMGSRVAEQMADKLVLDGARSVVDFGGGFGHYSKALLQRWPELRATVVDIPEVARIGARRAAATALAERLNFVPGDYLTSQCGSDFDAALLINVLHQERPSRAQSLIANAASHLRPGGQLVVLDFSIDDDKRNHLLGTLFSLNMRSFGDTYSEPEIRDWLGAHNIRHIERIDLNANRWIIVGRKGQSAP